MYFFTFLLTCSFSGAYITGSCLNIAKPNISLAMNLLRGAAGVRSRARSTRPHVDFQGHTRMIFHYLMPVCRIDFAAWRAEKHGSTTKILVEVLDGCHVIFLVFWGMRNETRIKEATSCA